MDQIAPEMSVGLPLGQDPREGGPARDLYRALRDARSAARAEERRQEAGGEGGPAVILLPEWAQVREIAARIGDEHACDVEVMAWLAEAEVRIAGFSGLDAALRRMAAAIRLHGAALHPQPEDAEDDTLAALAGLNGVGREGSLIGPLRLVPLAPGASYGELGLWDASQPGGEEALAEALGEAGPEAARARLAEIVAASEALDALDEAATALRGPEAPPFAQIRTVLEDAARMLRRVGNLASAAPEEAFAPEAEPAARAARAGPAGAPRTREEAFEQLAGIAAFFRRTEPHSPMAATIDTLIRRGRMDFAALLSELIPDEHARGQVLDKAGIKPPPEGG
jgi:type VI secretion system protein ImpA